MKIMFVGGPLHGELRVIPDSDYPNPVNVAVAEHKSLMQNELDPDTEVTTKIVTYVPQTIVFDHIPFWVMIYPGSGSYTVLSALLTADAYSTVQNYNKKD